MQNLINEPNCRQSLCKQNIEEIEDIQNFIEEVPVSSLQKSPKKVDSLPEKAPLAEHDWECDQCKTLNRWELGNQATASCK